MFKKFFIILYYTVYIKKVSFTHQFFQELYYFYILSNVYPTFLSTHYVPTFRIYHFSSYKNKPFYLDRKWYKMCTDVIWCLTIAIPISNYNLPKRKQNVIRDLIFYAPGVFWPTSKISFFSVISISSISAVGQLSPQYQSKFKQI